MTERIHDPEEDRFQPPQFGDIRGPFVVAGSALTGFAVQVELNDRKYIIMAATPGAIRAIWDDLWKISGSTEKPDPMDESKGHWSLITRQDAVKHATPPPTTRVQP